MAKQLRVGRFYLLPDGTPFQLLAIRERYGMRYGKVPIGETDADGIIPLENWLVHEDVLRRCPVIEPLWTLAPDKDN